MPTVVKSITLQPGETMSLPPDSTVLTITDDTYEASCELPDFEEYACYKITWSLNDNQDESPNLEHQDSSVEKVTISGTDYLINIDTHSYHANSGGDAGLKSYFVSKLPVGLIIVSHVSTDTTAERKTHTMYFQTVPSAAATMEMKVVGPGYSDGLYVKPVTSTECITP